MALFSSTPAFVAIQPRGEVHELPRLQTIARSTALTHPYVPPLDAMRQVVPRPLGKPKSKKPMTNSQRGIKFRQRQQERQIALFTNNQALRQQVLRLEALRDMHTSKALTTPYSTTGAPMKFVMEYFDQFRIGLRVPGAPATVLNGEKQKNFLNALLEPHTMFGDTPAADLILSIWERYSKFHSSVKLSCVSTNLIATDNCATVIVHGVLHLRYSRRTIENVYPNAASEENLIQKLIGDLGDCERILGRALIKGHVIGEEPDSEVEEPTPIEILSDSDSEAKEVPPACIAFEEERSPPASSPAMNLDYILS
ncbi:hypothetical protein BBP00_00006135 [Phytophthora kernoviae]|uniref:BZIP domain-containing protein n=1 Tax=Phytophthora kernoviae TaxID=325452 RepID=A0A3F2RLV3_9STRA|nr:hypothetical protein BBP00_00006135 [Phytophthora kernoviae]